eukprot:CAMPEP_0203911292 /NCGR_PEP_ID=MMETSP0359-20131031/52469_1 /ASSEMBLY_ACC=CAM_ASM_000338 /TAXON_ID=268821 /ORGANISM="Scrippsiella Hangoei, Strain SHTV-5" /LENGTH=319 /DNA_ID=CAMNT_0050836969 /DNA_START=49 /DNA_END=1008 /DNA_ORIENTATION=-
MAEGESLEQLEARHGEEEQELEDKIRSHVEAATAGAPKGKKAKAALEAAEREADQWRYDLTVRHQEERDALEESAGGGKGVSGGGDDAEAGKAASAEPPKAAVAAALQRSAEEEEAERAQRKKEKALKKRQGKAEQEADRRKELELERLNAGPSRRTLELVAISARLTKQRPPLKVLDVPGDGHCLYRAVGDQLRRARPELGAWTKKPDASHEDVRSLCASSLRRRREAYEAFAELNDGEDFDGYCTRVENSADWGGQLELRALADELELQIFVHRAEEAEPLIIGDVARGDPLHVTYHQFWYALGEHYNSAVSMDADE